MKRALSFLTILILVTSLLIFDQGKVMSATLAETIRRDLRNRISLINEIYTFSEDGGYGYGRYVEPLGIIITAYPSFFQKHKITEENLNKFFEKFGEAFASTKYPPETNFYILVEVGADSSLYIRTTAKAIYDYFKEKINREEFLKQCEIWIDGVKATIAGSTIKTPTKEFKMEFKF